jgi:hypothetical protein
MRGSTKIEGVTVKINGDSFKVKSFHYNFENDKLYVKLTNSKNQNINYSVDKVVEIIKEQLIKVTDNDEGTQFVGGEISEQDSE